MVMELCEGGTL